MIKPRLDEGMVKQQPDLDDSALADQLLGEIKDPLEVVFSISLLLDDEQIEQWYGGQPKSNQIKFPPLAEERYGVRHSNRWEEFKMLMKRGPVTFALLYENNGQAIQEWRNQMGNDWNIERVKINFPDSLRARFGIDNHNNLLHGSDSPDSARKEVNLLANFLDR